MNKKIIAGVLFSITLLTTGCSDSKESFIEDAFVWKKDCVMGGNGCAEMQKELMKRQKDLEMSGSELKKLMKEYRLSL